MCLLGEQILIYRRLRLSQRLVRLMIAFRLLPLLQLFTHFLVVIGYLGDHALQVR